MQAPTTNRVTQGKHGTYNAVDYSASPNSTFYAPEDGKITAYGASGTCGNRLELTAGSNRHGFCHLERSLVGVGQWVKKGQAIGIMGYTGYTIPSGPAGTHLHWVINRNGVYVYPPSLVNEQGGGTEVFANETEVQQAYQMLRGKNGTSTEAKGWVGQPQQRFFVVGKPEADAYRAERDNLKKALATVTAERDAARTQATKLEGELNKAKDNLLKAQADLNTSNTALESAKKAYEELKAEYDVKVEEINKVIEIKDKEIKRLSDELANCGGEPLTWSQHLVLGIKGLLSALNPLSK